MFHLNLKKMVPILRPLVSLVGAFAFCVLVKAQQWADNGFGQIHLDPALPPAAITLGDGAPAELNRASLYVRGDYIPVPDDVPLQVGMLNTFRTRVGSQVPQSWRMYRNINQIGAIWNEGQNRAWHVQSLESRSDGEDRYSGLLLQNHVDDGMWIMNDGPPTGGRAFPNALQLLDAKGFAALGRLTEALGPGPGNPRGPWSRLHLFHDVLVTRPHFAHRPQMRNGITLTGNSDHAYVGQWFDQGENGIGAEVDDHSNLIFSIGEDQLPVGLTNKWDNFSFRLFGDLDAASGASSNVEGQELLRVQPVRPTSDDPIEARVGIGDFVTPSDVPSHALDVRGGQVRVRDLPTDPVSASTEFVTVNTSTGVLEHRPLGALPDNCEWTMNGSAPNHVYTAVGAPDAACPDATDNVGIGTNVPASKLDVNANANNVGIRVTTAGANHTNASVNVFTSGASVLNIGVQSTITGTTLQNVGFNSVVNTTHVGSGSTAGGGTFNVNSPGSS